VQNVSVCRYAEAGLHNVISPYKHVPFSE